MYFYCMGKTVESIQKGLIVLAFLSATRLSVVASTGDDNWDSVFGVPGANGTVRAIALCDGDVYVGGRFSQIGGVNATNIAKWDGKNWVPLREGVNGGGFPGVFAMAAVGRNLYVGGSFTSAGSVSASNIARWDGTNWSSLGSGVDRFVDALAVQGSHLYVGGQFTTADSLPAYRLAKWDGTNWSTIGAITNATAGCRDDCFDDAAVFALATYGSTLYAGGRFVSAGGIFATNIAKWDGASWHALGAGVNGQVWSILADDANLIAGGDFSKAGALVSPAIARWDGINWSGLGAGLSRTTGPPSVRGMARVGEDLYAVGFFDRAGSSLANNLAKWDGMSWSELGSGITIGGAVWTIRPSGTDLYMGGIFTTAGSKPSTNIGLWHIPHALSVSRTGDTLLLSWPSTGTNFLLEASSDLGQT